ncbi:MAG TPA: hypothetical protein VGH41_07190 [Paraburkholderia sp.]
MSDTEYLRKEKGHVKKPGDRAHAEEQGLDEDVFHEALSGLDDEDDDIYHDATSRMDGLGGELNGDSRFARRIAQGGADSQPMVAMFSGLASRVAQQVAGRMVEHVLARFFRGHGDVLKLSRSLRDLYESEALTPGQKLGQIAELAHTNRDLLPERFATVGASLEVVGNVLRDYEEIVELHQSFSDAYGDVGLSGVAKLKKMAELLEAAQTIFAKWSSSVADGPKVMAQAFRLAADTLSLAGTGADEATLLERIRDALSVLEDMIAHPLVNSLLPAGAATGFISTLKPVQGLLNQACELVSMPEESTFDDYLTALMRNGGRENWLPEPVRNLLPLVKVVANVANEVAGGAGGSPGNPAGQLRWFMEEVLANETRMAQILPHLPGETAQLLKEGAVLFRQMGTFPGDASLGQQTSWLLGQMNAPSTRALAGRIGLEPVIESVRQKLGLDSSSLDLMGILSGLANEQSSNWEKATYVLSRTAQHVARPVLTAGAPVAAAYAAPAIFGTAASVALNHVVPALLTPYLSAPVARALPLAIANAVPTLLGYAAYPVAGLALLPIGTTLWSWYQRVPAGGGPTTQVREFGKIAWDEIKTYPAQVASLFPEHSYLRALIENVDLSGFPENGSWTDVMHWALEQARRYPGLGLLYYGRYIDLAVLDALRRALWEPDPVAQGRELQKVAAGLKSTLAPLNLPGLNTLIGLIPLLPVLREALRSAGTLPVTESWSDWAEEVIKILSDSDNPAFREIAEKLETLVADLIVDTAISGFDILAETAAGMDGNQPDLPDVASGSGNAPSTSSTGRGAWLFTGVEAGVIPPEKVAEVHKMDERAAAAMEEFKSGSETASASTSQSGETSPVAASLGAPTSESEQLSDKSQPVSYATSATPDQASTSQTGKPSRAWWLDSPDEMVSDFRIELDEKSREFLRDTEGLNLIWKTGAGIALGAWWLATLYAIYQAKNPTGKAANDDIEMQRTERTADSTEMQRLRAEDRLTQEPAGSDSTGEASSSTLQGRGQDEYGALLDGAGASVAAEESCSQQPSGGVSSAQKTGRFRQYRTPALMAIAGALGTSAYLYSSLREKKEHAERDVLLKKIRNILASADTDAENKSLEGGRAKRSLAVPAAPVQTAQPVSPYLTKALVAEIKKLDRKNSFQFDPFDFVRGAGRGIYKRLKRINGVDSYFNFMYVDRAYWEFQYNGRDNNFGRIIGKIPGSMVRMQRSRPDSIWGTRAEEGKVQFALIDTSLEESVRQWSPDDAEKNLSGGMIRSEDGLYEGAEGKLFMRINGSFWPFDPNKNMIRNKKGGELKVMKWNGLWCQYTTSPADLKKSDERAVEHIFTVSNYTLNTYSMLKDFIEVAFEQRQAYKYSDLLAVLRSYLDVWFSETYKNDDFDKTLEIMMAISEIDYRRRHIGIGGEGHSVSPSIAEYVDQILSSINIDDEGKILISEYENSFSTKNIDDDMFDDALSEGSDGIMQEINTLETKLTDVQDERSRVERDRIQKNDELKFLTSEINRWNVFRPNGVLWPLYRDPESVQRIETDVARLEKRSKEVSDELGVLEKKLPKLKEQELEHKNSSATKKRLLAYAKGIERAKESVKENYFSERNTTDTRYEMSNSDNAHNSALIRMAVEKMKIRSRQEYERGDNHLEKLMELDVAINFLHKSMEKNRWRQSFLSLISMQNINDIELKNDYRDIIAAQQEAVKFYLKMNEIQFLDPSKTYLDEYYALSEDEKKAGELELIASNLFQLFKYRGKDLPRALFDDIAREFNEEKRKLNPFLDASDKPLGYFGFEDFKPSPNFEWQKFFVDQFNQYRDKFLEYDARVSTTAAISNSTLTASQIFNEVKKTYRFTLVTVEDIIARTMPGEIDFIQLYDGNWLIISTLAGEERVQMFSEQKMKSNRYFKQIFDNPYTLSGTGRTWSEVYPYKFDNPNVSDKINQERDRARWNDFRSKFIVPLLGKDSIYAKEETPLILGYHHVTEEESNSRKPLFDIVNPIMKDVIDERSRLLQGEFDEHSIWHVIATLILPTYGEIYNTITDSTYKVNIESLFFDAITVLGVLGVSGAKWAKATKDIKKVVADKVARSSAQGLHGRQLALKALQSSGPYARQTALLLYDLVEPAPLKSAFHRMRKFDANFPTGATAYSLGKVLSYILLCLVL